MNTRTIEEIEADLAAAEAAWAAQVKAAQTHAAQEAAAWAASKTAWKTVADFRAELQRAKEAQ